MKAVQSSLLLVGLCTALSAQAQTSADAPASSAPAPAAAAAPTSPAPAQAEPATAPASEPTVPAKDQPSSAAAPSESAATAPVAPPVVAAGSIPPPPAGKGQVVFFRSSGFSGAAVWFNVRENGVALGKLSNGAYFVQVADPGPHAYTAATENKNTLHLEVDAGETYYIRGTVQMGFFIGEANMAPSDQATFEKALKHMHLAAPPPPATAKADAASGSK